MASETTTPTPTPDVTATAPTADTTTPDYTQQTTPAQVTPPTPDNQPTQPATAPASATSNVSGTGLVMGGQPSKVHGFLGRVALGALSALASGAKAVGREAGTVARNSPYGQELQKNELARQAEQQRMALAQKAEQRAEATAEQQATRASDEHVEAQVRTNGMSQDNIHKVLENKHLETLYPDMEAEQKLKLQSQMRQQNADDRDIYSTFASMGIKIDEQHGTGFDNLTADHAKAIASGEQTMISNGKEGKDAGFGFVNNRQLQQTPLTQDIKLVSDYTLDSKTGEIKPIYTTLSAGNNTAWDALIMHDGASKKFQLLQTQYADQLKNKATQEEIKLKGTEEEKNEAEAANQRAQAAQLGGEVMRHTSQQLVDGNEDPSQLTKRAKNYDAQMADADTYSMQTYGVHFNPAKAAIDFKYAQAPQTQNTLRYLNSLTGEDGKSGNLQELVNLSNKLKRTDFPALNDAAAWTRMEAGDPQIAAYHATLVEVADQVAKILQGGGTGSGTSDAKLKQAQDLFAQRFNKTQIQAIAGALHPLLGNRQREMIGNNRYLIKMFPKAAAPAGTASIGTGPDGRDYYLDANNKPIHVVGYGVQ